MPVDSPAAFAGEVEHRHGIRIVAAVQGSGAVNEIIGIARAMAYGKRVGRLLGQPERNESNLEARRAAGPSAQRSVGT